jgi:hypothetical protein
MPPSSKGEVHLLYNSPREGGPAEIWCTCHECFAQDAAAATVHLATASSLGEAAVPSTTVREEALAKSLISARLWVRQATGYCAALLTGDNAVPAKQQLRFLRDNLIRAAEVLEDPEADERSPDREHLPHTPLLVMRCIRCRKDHSADGAHALNQEEGIEK